VLTLNHLGISEEDWNQTPASVCEAELERLKKAEDSGPGGRLNGYIGSNRSNRSAECKKYGRQRLDSDDQSNYALRRCGATSISQSKTGNALQRQRAQFCRRFSSKGGYC
jgi:hypothetical protein